MSRSVFIICNTAGSSSPFSQVIRWEIRGTSALLGKKKKHLQVVLSPEEPLLVQLSGAVGWSAGECELHEADLSADQYYPRIYRPIFGDESEHNMRVRHDHYRTPGCEAEMNESLMQLASITDSLKAIFSVVSPLQPNLSVYGHAIRNLLVIASTEVESQLKGVLRENGYSGKRLTTNDYVKTAEALRLREYQVTLAMHPNLDPSSPFSSWDDSSPTTSLEWYAAYNAVKHDRESNFARATLRHVIDAVVACAVLLRAQYGELRHWKDQVGSFYHFYRQPKWDPYLSYTKTGYGDERWRAVCYPF